MKQTDRRPVHNPKGPLLAVKDHSVCLVPVSTSPGKHRSKGNMEELQRNETQKTANKEAHTCLFMLNLIIDVLLDVFKTSNTFVFTFWRQMFTMLVLHRYVHTTGFRNVGTIFKALVCNFYKQCFFFFSCFIYLLKLSLCGGNIRWDR